MLNAQIFAIKDDLKCHAKEIYQRLSLNENSKRFDTRTLPINFF